MASAGSRKHKLEESDLDDLFEFVKSGSSKWRDIGRSLKFTHAELSAIIPQNGLTEQQHYFEELLHSWLQRAPPCNYFPYTEDLIKALRDVKLHKLAYDLEKKTDNFMRADRDVDVEVPKELKRTK
ncbi:hypothetical protein EMCRGX_G011172 [Ephydatia muelleri]